MALSNLRARIEALRLAGFCKRGFAICRLSVGTVRMKPRMADLFSFRGMVRSCIGRWWQKVALAAVVAVLFRNSATELLVIGVVLALWLLMDVLSYMTCWDRHLQLEKKFGAEYDAVLAEKLRDSGFDQLVAGYWNEIRVELMRRQGLHGLP